ncbi:MAG: hypothetical protein R3C18_07770 [Planctomycetaceae bacterium]
MKKTFTPGDWVICRKTKHSTHPGPRAQQVAPASNGDQYSYTVDKFWVVTEVRDDGSVVLQTRRGKQHVMPADTPNLHVANFLERWWYGSRFRSVEQATQATAPEARTA